MLPLTEWSQHIKVKCVEQYHLSCDLCGVYPETRWEEQFHTGILSLDLSIIDDSSCEVICHTLSQTITPHSVTVLFSKETIKGDKKNAVIKVFKALKISLKNSKTLKNLKVIKCPITNTILNLICEGICTASRLQHLEFINCTLKDYGISQICQALKNVYSITYLGFIQCRMNIQGATAIQNLISHQTMNRSTALWQDTLRTRLPRLEKLSGVQHLCLNDNPHIGDEGFSAIMNALLDDIWLRGIELNNCGITSKSKESILHLLKTNQALEIFSLKCNAYLTDAFLQEIEQYTKDRASQISQENEVNPLNQREMKEDDLEEKIKKSLKLPQSCWPPKNGIPMQIERRIIERKEGLPAGSLIKIFEEVKSVCLEEISSKESNFELTLTSIWKLICHYKNKLKRERSKRKKVTHNLRAMEKRLQELERTLEENYLLDEQTLFGIEDCFKNFQNYVKKVKQLGYQWQKDVYTSPVSTNTAHQQWMRHNNRTEIDDNFFDHFVMENILSGNGKNVNNKFKGKATKSHHVNTLLKRLKAADEAVNVKTESSLDIIYSNTKKAQSSISCSSSTTSPQNDSSINASKNEKYLLNSKSLKTIKAIKEIFNDDSSSVSTLIESETPPPNNISNLYGTTDDSDINSQTSSDTIVQSNNHHGIQEKNTSEYLKNNAEPSNSTESSLVSLTCLRNIQFLNSVSNLNNETPQQEKNRVSETDMKIKFQNGNEVEHATTQASKQQSENELSSLIQASDLEDISVTSLSLNSLSTTDKT